MVVDDHDGPGGEIVANAARGGGEDDGAATGGDPGAQWVDHLGGGQALIEMASPPQHEYPAALVGQRPGVGPMPPRRVRREEGQGIERDGLLAGAQDLGRPGEAAAEEHEHVVVLGPEPAGQFPGALRRPVGGVLHGAMVEGGPPAGA